jgi:hypothetical protein
MDDLLFIAPDSALPEINSPAYQLLLILSDGKNTLEITCVMNLVVDLDITYSN